MTASPVRRLGRFAEPAMWVMIALRHGPREVARLFDEVRSLDGPMGHGTLFAAVSRLERLSLVERNDAGGGGVAYRLTQLGRTAAGSVAAIGAEGMQ